MKELVANDIEDVRHDVQSSQLMLRSARLGMKPLTYATDNSFMSQLSALSKQHLPVPWFVDGCGREASDSSKNECRLSRNSVSSSSQLVFLRYLKPWPLMMLVFRASTNCPTVGLLLEPQCKWITPNVFSRESWLRFRVSSYLKPDSFSILHTCWTAPILTSHPFCDGGGLLTRRRGVASAGRHSENITCRGMANSARHATYSHSLHNITTKLGANVMGLLCVYWWRCWLSYVVGDSSYKLFLHFFFPLELRVFFFAISTAVTRHAVTHCIISRQNWEKM
jgi:hypothetical protein